MGKTLRKAEGTATKAYGKALSAYKDKEGKPLPAEVKYGFSYWTIDDTDTLVAEKQELTLEEQRKVRNVESKTTARQAANDKALEALGIVKPDIKNDVMVRLKLVYQAFYAQNLADGMEDEDAKLDARKGASERLKVEWPEDED